jgi:zinc/manganese transport system permease protein
MFFDLLHQPFVHHALIAGAIVAVVAGVIGPFVITRNMAFAVHGISELAFTGASGALLLGVDPVQGALAGSVVVAAVIGGLGLRDRERDSVIGTILAFGLGLGVLFLSLYHRYATAAFNLLFGTITGVSTAQVELLGGCGVVVLGLVAAMYRPLTFASVDPEVAEARGVPMRLLSIAFLVVLGFAVAEAVQVVGVLLVLTLVVTPAAAAQRLTARPGLVVVLSVVIALAASVGGILISLTHAIPVSVYVSSISFGCYVVARLVGRGLRARTSRRRSVPPVPPGPAGAPSVEGAAAATSTGAAG